MTVRARRSASQVTNSPPQRYYTDTESHNREATKLLCPSIAKDIQVELLKSTVAQIPLFSGCSDPFVVAITSLLELCSVPAQFVLCHVGDFGDAMYIVHSGVLNVIIDGVKVREMRKGVCFGELSVFSASPRTATVVSAAYAMLYKLSRFHSERVLEGYPTCAAIIATHVLQLLETATKKKAKKAPTSTTSDVTVDTARRRRKSSLLGSSHHSLLVSSTALIHKSITNVTGRGRKTSQVAPAQHDDTIAETAGSPHCSSRVLGEVEDEDGSPRDEMQKRLHEQTLNYYSRHTLRLEHAWWRPLLLRTCIDADSHLRMWWILALLVRGKPASKQALD